MQRALVCGLALAVWPAWGQPAGADRAGAADRIQSDVTRLAADAWEGRRAGTPGADRAADWIAGEFQRLGLRPGGDAGTYFQAFSFVDGVDLGTQNRLQVSGRAFRVGQDFRPLAFSSSGSASAEVVFAGYGIVAKDLDYDDYAGVEVQDRVVVVLRYAPGGDDPHSKWSPFATLRQKASTARDRGARALLVVTGPATPDRADELVALRADASFADAGLPALSVKRDVVDALFARAGASLLDAQQRIDASSRPAPLALAGASVELVADVTPRRASTRNVVGVLPAHDTPAPQTLVVGAHYDHLGIGVAGMAATLESEPQGKLHHGADDNASGVAGLLELARRFAAQPRNLRRSIAFVAFGAEELGVLGSSHFVKASPLPMDSVVAMINMDMIGRLRDASLQLAGVGTSPVWNRLLEQANREAGLALKPQEGGYGPSDHTPFYAAGKPVLFAFTGAHSEYHRASDTADRINAGGVAQVVGLLESVIRGLAGSADPVAFTRVAADKEQATGTRGFRVWVGGTPDYSDEGVGVRFSGVAPGSPAEKGGLLAGDVLIRFGAKEIRNIYDYTYALGDHRPGDVVAVVVRRAGQEVALELTLAARPGAAR